MHLHDTVAQGLALYTIYTLGSSYTYIIFHPQATTTRIPRYIAHSHYTTFAILDRTTRSAQTIDLSSLELTVQRIYTSCA